MKSIRFSDSNTLTLCAPVRSSTNAPSIYREHQIAFFESHFTELKYGWIDGESGTSDPLLRWDISSASKWNTTWDAGVWLVHISFRVL